MERQERLPGWHSHRDAKVFKYVHDEQGEEREPKENKRKQVEEMKMQRVNIFIGRLMWNSVEEQLG